MYEFFDFFHCVTEKTVTSDRSETVTASLRLTFEKKSIVTSTRHRIRILTVTFYFYYLFSRYKHMYSLFYTISNTFTKK